MLIWSLKSMASNFVANIVSMVFSNFNKIAEAHHQKIIKRFFSSVNALRYPCFSPSSNSYLYILLSPFFHSDSYNSSYYLIVNNSTGFCNPHLAELFHSFNIELLSLFSRGPSLYQQSASHWYNPCCSYST